MRMTWRQERFEKNDDQPMTDEQINVIAETLADVPAALQDLETSSPGPVARIRAEQEAVAECRRRANSNSDILDMIIGQISVR
jgi:hypothetical protein